MTDLDRVFRRFVRFMTTNTDTVALRGLLFGSLALAAEFDSIKGPGNATSARLRAIAGKVSGAQVVNRFFGLLSTADSLLHPPKEDALMSRLTFWQNVSMLGYYPLEQICWFEGTCNAGLCSAETVGRCSRGSSMAWAAFSILGVIKAWIAIQKLNRTLASHASSKDEIATARRQKQGQMIVLLYHLSNCMLAMNWSLSKEKLSPRAVGWIGTVGTVLIGTIRWMHTVHE